MYRSFATEEHLVHTFCALLCGNDEPWGDLRWSVEFEYTRGRTDVVAVDERDVVITFEAKLTKWRYALQQAYRNTCFAHLSFVVLPSRIAQRALGFGDEFRRRNVGLCALGEDGFSLLLDCRRSRPIQPWLTDRAMTFVRGTDGRYGSQEA